MNVCCFVGRLTRDPELTYGQSGTAICKFTIAVDNPFAKQEPKADFIPVTTFGKTAESVANFMKKGRLVSAAGRWATGSYENNEGRKVYTNDLIADNVRFLDRDNTQQPQQPQHDPFADDGKPIDISDDDLPF
jgi:single-strand DNA-binding protein